MCFLKGSAGSGKSVDTAQHYILRLMNDSGRNLLPLRKSEVTNRDSTFAGVRSGFPHGALGLLEGCSVAAGAAVCQQAKIIFRGMNDDRQREKIKSITH